MPIPTRRGRAPLRRFAVPLAVCLALAVASLYGAREIWVDQSWGGTTSDGTPNRPWLTIQEAVDDAFTGDRVMVKPGTYVENVVINGLVIDVFAVQGPSQTTIDGGGLASAVLLDGAGDSSVEGFRITGGAAPFGGGVEVIGGMPTITRCLIEGNAAVQDGLGYGGLGGGIDAFGAPYTVIVDNLVRDNTADLGGAGVNVAEMNFGIVTFNTVVGNVAAGGGPSDGFGSGIHVVTAYSTGGHLVTNNIVAYNVGGNGTGGLEVYRSAVTIAGNVLYANVPNDFVSSEGPLPPDNLVADPRFVDGPGGDHHLRLDSPALDDIDLNWPVSPFDLDGNGRPVDADLDGSAVADRGCYEQVGQVTNLLVDAAGLVTWAPAASPPDAYHVYRGDRAGLLLGDAGTCQDSRDGDLTDTQFLESEVPPLGELFSFLATFTANSAEASLGLASSGVDRVASLPCP